MNFKICRILLAITPLLFMAACAGGRSNSDVSVSIQAEFEKRTITSSGLSDITNKPARYCWVEGFDPQTENIYFYGYLGSTGFGMAEVPKNANFKVRLYARYEVPGNNNFGSFRMRGVLKVVSLPTRTTILTNLTRSPIGLS